MDTQSNGIPSGCLIAKGVNMESESSHAASDIKGEVKEHVFEKWVAITRPLSVGGAHHWWQVNRLLLCSLVCVLEKGSQ